MMESVRERPPRPPPPTVTDDIHTRIARLHDESYLYIEQGLNCDEDGRTEQAVTLYKKGLALIDKALSLIDNVGNTNGTSWGETNKLVGKMKKTKLQITERVKNLSETDLAVQRSLSDPPPSYDASIQDDALMCDTVSEQNSQSLANACELFKVAEGVQIFYITAEGNVSAPSYPSSLAIYKFTDEAATARPPAFIQVGEWTYPLAPGNSPVLHSMWGAYVFPDIERQGSSVGVILPDSVTAGERNILENILNELTELRKQEEDFVLPDIPSVETAVVDSTSSSQDNRTSHKVAKGIVSAAEWISWGLEKGSEKAGELMRKGSALIQEKVTPQEEPVRVDPRAQQGAFYARKATGVAVKVSAVIITKLGEGTLALARMAAPQVRASSERYLPKSLTSTNSGGPSKLEDVSTVAMGGVQAWATVFVGLEKAARFLAFSLTQETVKVVKHKYGNEAGNLTQNTMMAAGNFGVTAYNFNNLGVKAIAKRAAKDTGKAVIEDYHNSKLSVDKNGVMDTSEAGHSSTSGNGRASDNRGKAGKASPRAGGLSG